LTLRRTSPHASVVVNDLLAPLGLFLAAALLLSIHLGSYPLLDPDEGRNAEVAREMAADNDYVMPRLNGLPYLDKPIFWFAASAAFMEILGPTTVAARLAPYLFALATALVAGWFGWRKFGRLPGTVAAVATLASPLMVAFSRIAIFDSALTFFITLAIIFFYESIESIEQERWRIGAWIAMALGVLTKGPIAILLPLLVASPFALWRRRPGALASWRSLVAFVAVLTPWLVAMSLRMPDFLHYALVTETLKRVATGELQRTGPLWYFLPYFVAGCLPWCIVVLTAAGSRYWRDEEGRLDSGSLFLLFWIVLPLLFFSISQSKRPQYILPVVPAIALLAGRIFGLRPSEKVPGVQTGSVVVAAIGAGLVTLVFADALQAKMRPELVAPAKLTAGILGGLLLAGGVVAFLAARERLVALAALSLPFLAIPLAGNPVLQELGRSRSEKRLAEKLAPLLSRSSDLVGVSVFSPSLAFYLRREIDLSSPGGAELTSNYLLRNYDHYAGAEGSSLHSGSWWEKELESCGSGDMFLAKKRDARARGILGSRLPLFFEGGRVVAYGPCGASSPHGGAQRARPVGSD